MLTRAGDLLRARVGRYDLVEEWRQRPGSLAVARRAIPRELMPRALRCQISEQRFRITRTKLGITVRVSGEVIFETDIRLARTLHEWARCAGTGSGSPAGANCNAATFAENSATV